MKYKFLHLIFSLVTLLGAFFVVKSPVFAVDCSPDNIRTCSLSVPPKACVHLGGSDQCVAAAAGSQPQSGLTGITNKAIDPILGGDPAAANSGSTFAHYFIVIWQGLIVIGTLAMLFNLVNGALEWVTAGGEAEKVKHARMKMTEGVVGLIILTGTFAAVMFIGQVFHFNVLQFNIPKP